MLRLFAIAAPLMLATSWLAPALGDERSDTEHAWKSLFNGKTLEGWKETGFVGGGKVQVKDGEIALKAGNAMTGITCTAEVPKVDYEISLEAMRVEGGDFFCGLTFPVKDSHASFIVGGWGGGVVGLSSINGADASENETSKFKEFKSGQWYSIRVRVTSETIQAWIDKELMVDLDYKDRRLAVRIEVESSRPLGIATWRTAAALRNIRLRRVTEPSP